MIYVHQRHSRDRTETLEACASHELAIKKMKELEAKNCGQHYYVSEWPSSSWWRRDNLDVN
jgi:hypothetical protein